MAESGKWIYTKKRTPPIKGTRIPVAQILSMLANGDTIDSLLNAYPSLELEDGLGCVEYAASLAE